MGLYSMALFGGNFLAPVWAGVSRLVVVPADRSL